jgi:hypothetical protein
MGISEGFSAQKVSAKVRGCPTLAYKYVVWAGKSARESMDATLFETAGEA